MILRGIVGHRDWHVTFLLVVSSDSFVLEIIFWTLQDRATDSTNVKGLMNVKNK